jgi:hypothetical protein
MSIGACSNTIVSPMQREIWKEALEERSRERGDQYYNPINNT